MIKAVGNKRLNLTKEEFDNYEELTKIVDKQEFVGLFDTDKNGNIVSICIDPKNNISMATIMFINQVMMNQRFKIYYEEIIKNSKKILEKILELDSSNSAAHYSLSQYIDYKNENNHHIEMENLLKNKNLVIKKK